MKVGRKAGLERRVIAEAVAAAGSLVSLEVGRGRKH